MSKGGYRFVLVSFFLYVVPAFAVRCPNVPFTPEKCEQTRIDARAVGCIDDATYARLKVEDRFPACVVTTYVGDCPCGCFGPETQIDVLGSNGALGVLSAQSLNTQWQSSQLASLEEKASLSSPRFVARDIKQATSGDESQPLVKVSLTDGRVLRLTEKHPVLKANGVMITARQLTKSDELVNRDGTVARIGSITREKHSGSVYNFETNGKTLSSHVIVAEGLLVGDLAWQNTLEEELGGVAARN